MAKKILKPGLSATEYSVSEFYFRFEPGVAVEIPEEHVEMVLRRLGDRLEDAPEIGPVESAPDADASADAPEGEKPKKGGKGK